MESWPAEREPVKVEVPAPATFKRLESERLVEDANWKEETPEVAMMKLVLRLFSTVRTPPMSEEPLEIANGVPGVVVAIPTKPLIPETASAGEEEPVELMRKAGMPLELARLSRLMVKRAVGEEVPMPT